jgi:hypothetical protein
LGRVPHISKVWALQFKRTNQQRGFHQQPISNRMFGQHQMLG